MPATPSKGLVPAAATAASYATPTPAVATAQPATPTPATVPVVAVQSNPAANGAHNLLRNRQCRQTGARIHLHSPVAPGTTFTTTCVTHGSVAHYPTRKAAKAQCYTPAQWCKGCGAVVQAKQAAAAAAVQANTPVAPSTGK